MSNSKQSFREALLNPEVMSVTWELIPGRGALEETQENMLKMAEQAAKSNRINSITVTDNPGGRPALSVSAVSIEVSKLGIEPLIHFTCKDRNRNAMQSELYALERAGLKNLLVMTGDYPAEGYTGRPKPVFDIDSVQALRMIEAMNQGEIMASGKNQVQLMAANFYVGAVVSPFKNTEAEQIAQYYKLQQKIRSGAKFIITQLGYDPRKFDELRRYMQINNLNVPLVGNIFVLSAGIAKAMNKNLVPGCVVTDGMLKALEEEKSQYGNVKERQLIRAAKQYAILKGLEYDGVNISGHGLKYSDVEYILEKGKELSVNWHDISQEFQAYHNNSFYFFKKDDSTGLNTNETADIKTSGVKKFSLAYKLFEGIHYLFFTKGGPLYSTLKSITIAMNSNCMQKVLKGFEFGIKHITNDCRSCGDCAMLERAYICPMSQCPKQQRNGPCGGSCNGWCEVYPNKKKCIYVRAYERLKLDSKEIKLKESYIRPYNWDLYETSSWYNFFTAKDWQGFCDSEIKEGGKNGKQSS